MRISAICLKNLKRRRLRTILCICGIAFSIAFLVGVSATTLRVMAIVREMNFFFEDEIIVVARNTLVIQGFPIGGTIPEKTVDELEEIAEVEDAVPMLFILELRAGEVSGAFPANVTIGLPFDKLLLLFPSVFLRIEGYLPSDQYKEVLVGRSIADQHNLFAGSSISFGGKNLTVAGVIRGPSIILSRSIIMSLRLLQELQRYEGQINMVVVKLKPNADVEEVADKIEKRINYVMALTESERNELTYPILEELSFWNYGTKIFMLIISGMLVATVEIMNVSESRRDFATLIAIGAPETSIFKMILAETSLLGVLGGSLGLLFGGVAAVFFASIYTDIPAIFFIQDFFNLVPPRLIAEALALAILICILSGIVPTFFVLRTNISETLRAEY